MALKDEAAAMREEMAIYTVKTKGEKRLLRLLDFHDKTVELLCLIQSAKRSDGFLWIWDQADQLLDLLNQEVK